MLHARAGQTFASVRQGRRLRSRPIQLSGQRADVVALDQAAGRATVAIELLEIGGSPATTRRWVGTWQPVRAGNQWLLDQPA